MSRRRMAVLISGLLLAGCGVPADSKARPINAPPGAFPGVVQDRDAPMPGTGTAQERLYMVRDERLIRVTRRVSQDPDSQRLLTDLLVGPTSTERNDGITSALPAVGFVSGVRRDDGIAEVQLAAALGDTGRSDEVIALAQLVCTLTTPPQVRGVYFVRDGRRVAVPRADGSLTQGPLTAADYAPLLRGA